MKYENEDSVSFAIRCAEWHRGKSITLNDPKRTKLFILLEINIIITISYCINLFLCCRENEDSF
mgnify:CR=1 FL=1